MIFAVESLFTIDLNTLLSSKDAKFREKKVTKSRETYRHNPDRTLPEELTKDIADINLSTSIFGRQNQTNVTDQHHSVNTTTGFKLALDNDSSAIVLRLQDI